MNIEDRSSKQQIAPLPLWEGLGESLEYFLSEWNNDSPFVEVKTSGSTGTPKRMLVEKSRMLASAKMTCDFLGLKEGDTALLCMSTDYIAGKMMVVRSIERGLRLTAVKPSNHPLAGLTEPFDFIAMVPSQVYETLKVPEEASVLARSKNIIIGGGAISKELQSMLNSLPLTGDRGLSEGGSFPMGESGDRGLGVFFSTYGMTETLSHIALRLLTGPQKSDWYTPFEGVEVSLNDEGCLVINAPLVCKEPLTTNDIAELLPLRGQGGLCFRIKGRKDNVICSGGIKIQIEEVEGILSQHLSEPFAITKTPDEKFGEAVVLVTESTDLEKIEQTCRQVLPRYFVPRHYIHLDKIPLTETGKIARAELKKSVNLCQ